jgi:hypothetical protein
MRKTKRLLVHAHSSLKLIRAKARENNRKLKIKQLFRSSMKMECCKKRKEK